MQPLATSTVAACLLTVVSAEIPSMSDVRREGDGVDIHRGAQVDHQSADEQPRECAGGQGWRRRLKILAQQVQTIQQVCQVDFIWPEI